VIRRTAALLGTVLVLAPAAASARATVALDGGSLAFFADTLAIVARGGATLGLADGTRASADAAFVDLRNDRAVLAGHAHVARAGRTRDADAIVVDLDGPRVDLLDAASGVTETTRALAAPKPAGFDAERFAFPDVDDRTAFIRSRRARITPHADVRFVPASFPTSVGGVPVPSYLYTYASAVGFSANSLPGSTFDQPYGLWGSPTSLTAVHARWEQGPGVALGLQQQVVSGDDAYASASLDAPIHGYSVRSFNAYRRMGARYTIVADGTDTIYGSVVHVGTTAAFGAAGGRVDYSRNSAGGSSFTAALRSPDRPLFGGATYRLTASMGFDAQRGGLLGALPNRSDFATVWRHGVDVSLASPTIRAPFGATLTATVDGSRTWYAFPHHSDALSGAAQLSKTLIRRAGQPRLALLAGYLGSWSQDVYPTAQGIFYPTPIAPILLPDGTPYYGYAAFSGATTYRAVNVDLQYTPDINTTLRVSAIHTSDFPQFEGFGRPLWALRADARFRPFPNIGLDIGREYDFAWGGTRWLPRWSFAITP
jgi:hypothetical protein